MSTKTTFKTAIVWTGTDGVVKFAPVREEGKQPEERDSDYHVRVAFGLVIRGYLTSTTPWQAIPLTSFPGSANHNRRFRGSWELSAGSVVVNMARARLQVLEEIRTERDALLVTSDAERARLDDIGSGQQRQALAQYRQALRDLPAVVVMQLEALATPEELEAYQPPWPSYVRQ